MVLKVDPRVRVLLRRMAKAEGRTLGGQFTKLIVDEARARDMLKPPPEPAS
jgi:hypothetical protein